MKHTFKISNLRLPTPKIWRKIGNSLLATSVFIGGFSLYQGHQWIAITSFATGVIGTLLTNMFAE